MNHCQGDHGLGLSWTDYVIAIQAAEEALRHNQMLDRPSFMRRHEVTCSLRPITSITCLGNPHVKSMN